MNAPINPGHATSANNWSVEYLNPTPGSRVAVTLQTIQIEKPIFSATMDQSRLRRATRLPVRSQNVSSSGFHSVIHFDMCCTVERTCFEVILSGLNIRNTGAGS